MAYKVSGETFDLAFELSSATGFSKIGSACLQDCDMDDAKMIGDAFCTGTYFFGVLYLVGNAITGGETF